MGLVRLLLLPAALALGVAAPGKTYGVLISITSVAGFPNERTSDDPPANAVDGDVSTYTWTTEAFTTTAPCYLAVGFSPTNVNRIRLWKAKSGGTGEDTKNTFIQYTRDDSASPLDARTWQNVRGLQSGYNGDEPFNASAVDPCGSVTGDVHDSPSGDGWGSLTFDTVTATGLRIGFSNPGFITYNHYRVGEFQVHVERGARLQISLAGNNVLIWWPTNALGLALETSARLGTNQNWHACTDSIFVIGDQNVAVAETVGGSKFFRLRGP